MDTIRNAGKHLRLEDARVFDLPDQLPDIAVAAGGLEAARLAGELGDALFVTEPRADLIAAYEEAGGAGDRYPEVPLAWATSMEDAAESARRLFRFGVTGWKVQAELPNPVNFDADRVDYADHMRDQFGTKELAPALRKLWRLSSGRADRRQLQIAGWAVAAPTGVMLLGAVRSMSTAQSVSRGAQIRGHHLVARAGRRVATLAELARLAVPAAVRTGEGIGAPSGGEDRAAQRSRSAGRLWGDRQADISTLSPFGPIQAGMMRPTAQRIQLRSRAGCDAECRKVRRQSGGSTGRPSSPVVTSCS